MPPRSNPTAPSDFATVARRLRGGAINLLAMGLVLLLGLLLGREVIGWWQDDAAPLPLVSATHDPTTNSVQVGSSASPLEVQPLVGDRTVALQALCTMGQRALTAAAKTQSGGPSLEEQRLLEQLPRATLVGNVDGGALYTMPGELLTVVAVRRDVEDRVVFCGLGLEASEKGWSLYGIRYSPDDSLLATAMTLPPGAKRVLSLASGAQASTLVFTGESPQVWLEFYRSQATRRNWQVVRDWQTLERGWQATYRTRGTPAQHVELQFRPRDAGRWVGLVTTQAMASSE